MDAPALASAIGHRRYSDFILDYHAGRMVSSLHGDLRSGAESPAWHGGGYCRAAVVYRPASSAPGVCAMPIRIPAAADRPAAVDRFLFPPAHLALGPARANSFPEAPAAVRG